MELEQIKNELQRQKEEIRGLKEKIVEHDVKICHLYVVKQTKSRSTKKTVDEQPTVEDTISPATKFLDTFNLSVGQMRSLSAEKLFHRIQRYICVPQQFTESVYREVSNTYDSGDYNAAKQAIIELSVNPSITSRQFAAQLAKDGKYVEIHYINPYCPKESKPAIIRRF